MTVSGHDKACPNIHHHKFSSALSFFHIFFFFFLVGFTHRGLRKATVRRMAAADRRGHPTRNSLYWDETHALNYYGMMSLHEVFEIVGSQLTVTDVEALSFLLNETYSALHPLDPVGWTVEPSEGNPDVPGIYPSPELLKTWRRIKPQSSQDSFHPLCKPTSGPELLLDLERRGYISDGNLEPLLQLLRVLTRHDLLPYVSHKKRRRGDDGSEVSPQTKLGFLFLSIAITAPSS